MKVFLKIIVLSAIVVLVYPLVVQATSLVGTTFDPDGFLFTVQFEDGVPGFAQTGPFSAQIRGEDGQLVDGGEWFTAFCFEFSQPAQLTEELEVQFVNPGDVIAGMEVAWLFDSYYHENATFTQRAALQIAIWEVLIDYSGSYDLSLGDFKILVGDADVLNLATGYLAKLPESFDVSYLNANYSIALHPEKQDLIFRTPIPEPSTLLLLGIGLLGIFRLGHKTFSGRF